MAYRTISIAALMAIVVSTSGTIGSAQKTVAPKPCRQHPLVNGPCFTVHGRMNLWNGTPSVRIWPIGTKRMLGVSEGRFYKEGYDNLPESLSARLKWDTDVFGDFLVCPFEDDRPGAMRLVCVDSAKNLITRPRK